MSHSSAHGRLPTLDPALLPQCGETGYLFPDAPAPQFSAATPGHPDRLQDALHALVLEA